MISQRIYVWPADFSCLSVCLSVRDGCGHGFSLKLFILGLQRAARYVRHATVGVCHRTSNRQEHKIIQRAGPEQDTIFHLHVTACRLRGSYGHDERLANVNVRDYPHKFIKYSTYR